MRSTARLCTILTALVLVGCESTPTQPEQLPLEAAPATPPASADPALTGPLRRLAGKQTAYVNGVSALWLPNATGTALYEFLHSTAPGQMPWQLTLVTKWSHHYQAYCYRRVHDASEGAVCLTVKGDTVGEVKRPAVDEHVPWYSANRRLAGDTLYVSMTDARQNTTQPISQVKLTPLTGAEKNIPPTLLARADALVADFENFITYGERNYKRTQALWDIRRADRESTNAWFAALNSAQAGLTSANQSVQANRQPALTYGPTPAPARTAQPSATAAAAAPHLSGASPTVAAAAVNAPPAPRPAATAPAAPPRPASAPTQQKSSTNEDPSRCVSQPSPMPNPLCKEGTAFAVRNACEQPVDVRLCIKTNQGIWDCGAGWGVKPGASWSYPSCRGTSTTFLDVRSSSSNRRLNDPPR